MPAADELKACAACGATIYPEHIERHTADYHAGKLLCSFCLEARRGGDNAKPGDDVLSDDSVLADESPPGGLVGGTKGGGLAVDRPAAPKIQLSSVAYKEPTYKRALLGDSSHATRCKTFHCKMADAPIVHLNEQINEWVDAHPDVAIKFATQTVGVIEGKHSDPHLLITIFY